MQQISPHDRHSNSFILVDYQMTTLLRQAEKFPYKPFAMSDQTLSLHESQTCSL
mgnify:CR=1 FL=1